MSDEPFDPEDEFEEPDYAIGYGRPPSNRQFGAGPDANPRRGKGRPKGTRNRMAVLRKVLTRRRKFMVDGKARSMTLLEAVFRKLRDMALDGNERARALLEQYAGRAQLTDEWPVQPAVAIFPEGTDSFEEWRYIYGGGPKPEGSGMLGSYRGDFPELD